MASYNYSDRQKELETNIAQKRADGWDRTSEKKAAEYASAIENRKPFEYDVNGDALYQQYKDSYTKQGQLAMQDSIGKASAMTGGYGNSYAQQVGQQTFNGYMSALNDKIPELYALAYDKYNQETADLYNLYGLYNADADKKYSQYMDGLSLDYDDLASEINQNWNITNLKAQEEANNATITAAQIKANWEAQRWALENGYNYDTTTGAMTKTPEAQSADYATTLAPYIEVVSEIPTAQGRKLYIESLSPKEDEDGNPIAGSGTLSEEEAAWLGMNYYDSVKNVEEYIPLQYRDWKQNGTDGTKINWWGGMNRDAMVIDQFDNEKTLGELYDDLEATIGKKAAKDYILALQEEIGISGGWIW